VGQIDTLAAPERIRRGMGEYPIPLVILARLAIDLDYQRRGLGFSLLQDAIGRTVAITEQAGIRALLTHPIDAEAGAFYCRFGFEPTPAHERQLILLLKDVQRFVRA
jgi:GNAT superfamily N-acetyltransferase